MDHVGVDVSFQRRPFKKCVARKVPKSSIYKINEKCHAKTKVRKAASRVLGTLGWCSFVLACTSDYDKVLLDSSYSLLQASSLGSSPDQDSPSR